MPLTYRSGQQILPGDHVHYHGQAGVVEFVAEPGDPATDWYVQQFGPGAMLNVPDVFGNVFVSESEFEEDLELVSRGEAK
jgi:hypothetical protein